MCEMCPRLRPASVRWVTCVADEGPGKFGELDDGRQYLGYRGLLDRIGRLDGQKSDDLPVVGHRCVSQRVNADTLDRLVVRVSASSVTRLDPRTFEGPAAQLPAAVERELLQGWVGLARDDETDWYRITVGREEKKLGGADPGETRDLAADRPRGVLGRLARAQAAERFEN